MKWQSFIRAITLRTMSMAERSEAMNQHDARMGAAVVRRQSIVSRVATVAGLALLGLLLGLATPTAWAGTAVTSHASFAGNINFVTTGGTFRTSPNTNNPDSVTTTSSGTLSGIPAGSTIVAAYLYYAASGTTADANVTFNNIAVVADRTFTDTTVSPFYSGFEDVTATVTSTGNGTYTMKNLAISTGNTWTGNQTVLGGWALVVIYSNDTTETNRVINVFDGFQAFQNSSITLTPNNFKVPTTGINGKFAVITWEGDPGPAPLDTGETVAFNGTALSDACNGTGNQYNSTINTLSCTGNDTLDDKYYGVDIDTYNIGSQLGAGNTSATTFYQSGQDAVLLSAQIISVANVPVADLSISKSHTGNFTAGSNASYSIVVHNSGPGAATGTTTVTDTLPTGLSYVSGSTGWTCSASGQTVTCTSTTAIAKGADLPLTLTVAVAANAPNSVDNTATVSSTTFEINTSNNTSNKDTATIVHPDLSTSTKDVVDVNGGDTNPGDTLRYTITLKESGGVAASNVSVTDDMPANVTGFNVVSTPAGSTNASIAGGGAHSTGRVNVTGINVPANGSVTIVYEVTVANSASSGDTIDNTATVTNPSRPDATPAAPTVVVSQSQIPASGNKILYVYNNGNLSRIPQAQSNTGITLASRGGTQSWTLTPAIAAGKSLVLQAGTISVNMDMLRSGTSGNRTITAQLFRGGTQIGTTATVTNFNSATVTQPVLNITLSAPVTIPAGGTVTLTVTNTTTTNTRPIIVYQYHDDPGTVSFNTSTVINVDSVNTYSAAYNATTTKTPYSPGNTVYVRAVISDPFGSFDVHNATITLTDPSGTIKVTAATMSLVADSGLGNATRTYEYAYALPSNATTGYWTASVTGHEGTENTVTHTANAAFDVEVLTPNLLVLKSVTAVSDPVEGTTNPKAMPGATMQYQIIVTNNGNGPPDSNSLIVTDPLPTDTKFVPGSVAFLDGSPTSGLTLVPANVTYFNSSNISITPADDGSGADPNVTKLQIAPQGIMAAKTGATAPSFSVVFNVIIK
jgi:uncharacterized repeat protein (TIGR01451 family)